MNTAERTLKGEQILLVLLSFVIVAFGQPAWSGWLGQIAAALGFALFGRFLLFWPKRLQRFWAGTAWFTAVQLVQLSWLVSHPYLYIYGVYFALSFAVGVQFGILSIFITYQQLAKWGRVLALAGLWTIFEWLRLFFLSGFSWNPVGLALTSNTYSLQMGALFGVFGLSFWVILTNLAALKAWVTHRQKSFLMIWTILVLLPYLYGFVHLRIHDVDQEQKDPFHVVLVQTAFPVEEMINFRDPKALMAYVIKEWKQILSLTEKHRGKPVDLIALPEFVVPYGTYNYVFPLQEVKKVFQNTFDSEQIKKLPPLEEPWARQIKTNRGDFWFVNNAYWLQGIANIFSADVVAGLEDAEDVGGDQLEYYSAALYFQPSDNGHEKTVGRYEKRVLVPMGEYIPFDFVKKLAAAYGIQGSLTCGKEAKVFSNQKLPVGVSICYEETFGHLMRENRQNGAGILVNLTNDAWYPSSRLLQQHLDHARLRTVENGIPLIRACNTGITCGLDSHGRTIATLGEDIYEQEWQPDSLYASIPTHSYHTLYTKVGDFLIIALSLVFLLLFLRIRDEEK